MSKRIIPQHFRRDGRAKRSLSRTQAEKLAKQYKQKAYRCTFCGAWHLARRKGR